MALFPLLVAGGFMAPGVIQVLALAQELTESERAHLVDRTGPYGHRPLLVPRDFSAGFTPELLDLDQLFLGSEYRVQVSADSLARVTSFPRSHGDSIVIDDGGEYVEDITFKDILMEEPPMLLAGDAASDLMPLCGTLHASNCVRDDDLVNGGGEIEEGTPIPEPGTGVLVALGLIALGYRRRASLRS
jgi:hypothetical protein